MDTLTYSEARSKLATTMDKVCDNHAPIIITRKNSQSVVMMSLDDYQALEETARPKKCAPSAGVDCGTQIHGRHQADNSLEIGKLKSVPRSP